MKIFKNRKSIIFIENHQTRFKKKSHKSDGFKLLKKLKMLILIKLSLEPQTVQTCFWMTFCLFTGKNNLFSTYVHTCQTFLSLKKPSKCSISECFSHEKTSCQVFTTSCSKNFNTVIRRKHGFLGFKAFVLINVRNILLEKSLS